MKNANNILLCFLTTSVFYSGYNNLPDTNWKLVSMENLIANQTQFADTSCGASLHFDSNGKYDGNSGCNEFKGEYSLKGDNGVVMNDPVRTKRGCPSQVCQLGETLFGQYTTLNKYSIKNDTLILLSNGVKIVYKKSK